MMPVFYEIYLKIPESDCIFSLFPIFDMRQDRMMTMRDELGLDMKKFSLSEIDYEDLMNCKHNSLVKPGGSGGDQKGGNRTLDRTETQRSKGGYHDNSYHHTGSNGDNSIGEKQVKRKKNERLDQTEVLGKGQKPAKGQQNKEQTNQNDKKGGQNGQGKQNQPGNNDEFTQGGSLNSF